MKPLCLFFFCFLHLAFYAQDTICKRTGECFAAKVLEINIDDIKFKKADNLDGPLFICSKKDIYSIKYRTGKIDTFALVAQNNTLLSAPAGNGYIELKGARIFYNGSPISDDEFLILVKETNTPLYTDIQRQMGRALVHKKISTGMAIGAIPMYAIGGASLFATMASAFSGASDTDVNGYAAVGLSSLFIAASLQVYSGIERSIAKRYRRKAVNIYSH